MKELLEHIVKGILGKDNFEVTETTDDEGRVQLVLDVPQEDIGLIIGKGGTTIKSIRNILRVRSALTDTPFHLNLKEDE